MGEETRKVWVPVFVVRYDIESNNFFPFILILISTLFDQYKLDFDP